jgi:hypothetical protein
MRGGITYRHKGIDSRLARQAILCLAARSIAVFLAPINPRRMRPANMAIVILALVLASPVIAVLVLSAHLQKDLLP